MAGFSRLRGRLSQGHIGQIATVSYSPNGHAVASGAADATIRLWDATRGQQISGVQVRPEARRGTRGGTGDRSPHQGLQLAGCLGWLPGS